MFAENDRIFLKNYIDTRKFLNVINLLQRTFYYDIVSDSESLPSHPITISDKKDIFLKTLSNEKNKYELAIGLNLTTYLNYLIYKNNYFSNTDNLIEVTNKNVNSEFIKFTDNCIKIINRRNEIINEFDKFILKRNEIVDSFKLKFKEQILYYFDDSQKTNTRYLKKRLILQLEKKSAENLIKNNNLQAQLLNLTELIKECNSYFEVQKKSKTAQLIKERSRLGLESNWPTEKSYLNSMLQWKNDFITEQFIGLAGQYVDWKQPIAYFDPNIAELLRYLVAGDPFYVIDNIILPYKRLIQKLPEESRKKIYYYNKKDADTYLEKNSVGLCVSWNNFPFYTQGKIYSDLQLMSKILRPGGYAVFNYANSHTVAGAKFVENHDVPIVWKERIGQYANEHDLISIKDCEYVNYPFTISVYQKKGSMPSLNLINKLGLVLRKK